MGGLRASIVEPTAYEAPNVDEHFLYSALGFLSALSELWGRMYRAWGVPLGIICCSGHGECLCQFGGFRRVSERLHFMLCLMILVSLCDVISEPTA